MTNEKELQLAGMDVASFLARIMNNEALVKLFVKKFVEDSNFALLEQAVEAGDLQAATSACHTLKGMCGNMSLTRLFELLQLQLAAFRGGENDKAVAMMTEIVPLYQTAISHMKAWLEEQ